MKVRMSTFIVCMLISATALITTFVTLRSGQKHPIPDTCTLLVVEVTGNMTRLEFSCPGRLSIDQVMRRQ